MPLLQGLTVGVLGAGKAASVCGRLFADTGARVLSDAQSADANSSAFTAYLRRDFENTGMDGAATVSYTHLTLPTT